MSIYYGGEHIQIVEKCDTSTALPNSLGFISYFEQFGQLDRDILVWPYVVVFYRIGKTGKPRIVMDRLRLLVADKSFIDAEHIAYEVSHVIRVIDKLNLLNCPSIGFVCYVISKLQALYNFVKFTHVNARRSLIDFVTAFDLYVFEDLIYDETVSLSYHVQLPNDKLANSYIATFIAAMKNNTLASAILKRYENVDLRKSELQSLQYLFARYHMCYTYYLKHTLHRIDISIATVERNARHLLGIDKDILLLLLENIREDMRGRFYV